MTHWRGIALVFVLTSQSLIAQVPADSSATVRRLLPVLDDFGQVIPEDSIRANMRAPDPRLSRVFASALVGAAAFHLLRPRPAGGADCSIYEPCTPREKFHNTYAWRVGFAVGAMIGYGTVRDRRVDRWQAVEMLRARRRAQHQPPPATPP